VTYDGTAHTAAGTATGAGGVNLAADLNLGGTTHTNAGSYANDGWSFTDLTGNYASASGTVSDKINQANATINITPYTVTYDTTAHTATGTATGAGGVNLAADLNLGGTTHTNAGSYANDGWSFTDLTGNYSSTSGTVSDKINQANATINITPYTVTYDGAAHTATGTATGVGGVNLAAGLSLSSTTHTSAGPMLQMAGASPIRQATMPAPAERLPTRSIGRRPQLCWPPA
jgi:alpha-glucosidase (family GH31 glycosyl hydrolase)